MALGIGTHREGAAGGHFDIPEERLYQSVVATPVSRGACCKVAASQERYFLISDKMENAS